MAASGISDASGSMKDFKIVQLLGKGSYGSVYKVKRRTDSEM
jgi:serine/threonine protein kinase